MERSTKTRTRRPTTDGSPSGSGDLGLNDGEQNRAAGCIASTRFHLEPVPTDFGLPFARRYQGALSSLYIPRHRRRAAMIETIICPDPKCLAPAEVLDQFDLSSTDGPIEHIRTRCVVDHVYTVAADRVYAGTSKPSWPTLAELR
jgi:hypothetical protein